MAAPAETRTPNWHRAHKNRSSKSADGGRDSGNSAGKKQRDQQIPKPIPLTPTGLLMEGDYLTTPAGIPTLILITRSTRVEMALFNECMQSCAHIVLDNADIVDISDFVGCLRDM